MQKNSLEPVQEEFIESEADSPMALPNVLKEPEPVVQPAHTTETPSKTYKKNKNLYDSAINNAVQDHPQNSANSSLFSNTQPFSSNLNNSNNSGNA